LIGINPKHYTPEAANQIVSNIMEKKSPRKCPPLRMIYTSPRISLDDRHISSKVYAIEYKRKHAKEVIQKLKDTFAGSTQFLMAKLCYTHPQSFANALKMQNQIMKDTFVLPLVNVTSNEMFYLEPLLEQISGVITIMSTQMTPTSGRYNILISAGKFKEVKGNIVTNFSDIYNKVPSDARQNPDALMFMGSPRIRVAADNEDESNGAISFLTTSTASFASFDMSTTDDAFETFTPATRTYSWSKVAQQKAPPIPSEVTTPIPAATVTTASHAVSAMTSNPPSKIQSLREEYEAKLGSNAAEIAELKIMLQQVLQTLQHIKVQQEASNAGFNNQTKPMVTDNNDDMVVSYATAEENATPKCSGKESPTYKESSQTKRPDHKPSQPSSWIFVRMSEGANSLRSSYHGEYQR
jgi:hypothetical protein